MRITTLTELVRDDDLTPPLRAYIFNSDGFHRGGLWFGKNPGHEELATPVVKGLVDDAIRLGLEVRITNGSDFLVFHSKDGQILYPVDVQGFWEKALDA